LKNWALIAKYRSLGKKIIGFFNDNGESVDMPELDKIKERFDEMEEEDSLLVNRKFVSEDLTFNGSDNMMSAEMEHLRKDSGSALVPNFMTAFSQDSAMATAAEAKIPFALELTAMQEELSAIFNSLITEDLKKNNKWLAADLSLTLRAPELYSRDEQSNVISQAYNSRVASFNEYRKALGLPTVTGGDIWGSEPPLTNIKVDNTITAKPFAEKYKNKALAESIVRLKYTPVKKKECVVEYEEKDALETKKEQFKAAVKKLLL